LPPEEAWADWPSDPRGTVSRVPRLTPAPALCVQDRCNKHWSRLRLAAIALSAVIGVLEHVGRRVSAGRLGAVAMCFGQVIRIPVGRFLEPGTVASPTKV